MKIERHNYETFFLLYTDNELSVAERKAVDEFVQANPDLQEEFIMLQQSIIKPEHIVFEGKSLLFKKEELSERIQEDLLLHLDNELNESQKTGMNEMVVAGGAVQKEWSLLQQTKVVPDLSIVFPDKKSLYRKEGGRVVALPLLKMAAAAVFLGVVVWGGVRYFNSTIQQAPFDIVTNDKTGNSNNQSIAPSTVVKDTGLTIIQHTIKAEVATNKSAPKVSTIKKLVPAVRPTQKARIEIEPEMIANTISTNNLPQPDLTKINNNERNKTVRAIVPPLKQAVNNNVPGKQVIEPSDHKMESANSFATTASFSESSEDKNSDRIFFMDEEKIKKTKLGGMFRKVKRVFERNANIKEGNNRIKVANLEFAIQ